MTTSEKTDAWRDLFSELKIDVQSSSPPASAAGNLDERSWFETLTCFTRRGFLRVLVTPGDEHLGVHTQYAVPGADSEYARLLKRHLSKQGGVAWTSETAETPWTLFAEDISMAHAKAIIEVFLRVSDHIKAAEDGARASVLAQEFDAAAKADAETSSSPFETIGDAASSNPSSSKPGPSAPKPASAPSDLHDSVPENPGLKAFRVAVRDGVIHADVDLDQAPAQSMQRSLLDAFSQALPVRFDITMLSADFAGSGSRKTTAPASIHLAMRANIAGDTGEIAGELGRYFERTKKFNDYGLALLEAVGGRPASPKTTRRGASASRESAGARRRDSGASPGRDARDAAHAAASENVVLSFGGGALDVQDITSDALRPGDYADPRIRRDDATTPLVDVVLRHPGFREKSMHQVLSILLDITYYDATKLTAAAPCLIAWGVSQERAMEFKSVIENAGGRVTLVEPDSLS